MKRRKPIRQVSDRQKVINACLDMIRIIIKHERGAKCEICGRNEAVLPYPLGLFHVLDRQRYSQIQLEQSNILLACWVPNTYNVKYCHNIWHHLPGSDPAYQRVEKRIKELVGVNYRDKLGILVKCAPKLSMTRLGIIYVCLKQEMKGIEAIRRQL